MTQAYQQVSDVEWRWQDGGRNQCVRLFARTHRLIWSSWMDTSEGPVFENGLTQTFDTFLSAGAPPGVTLPPALQEELEMALNKVVQNKRRKRFCSG